jgi:hypothetical protein
MLAWMHNRAFCEESRMPWKACKPMDERLKFVARLLDREQMAGLCRELGISRKTGYKSHQTDSLLNPKRALGLAKGTPLSVRIARGWPNSLKTLSNTEKA